MLQQYFDRATGRQLTAAEALIDGILRDGVVQRVRMSARDSRMPHFTNDDFRLNRPGFRSGNDGTLDDYLMRDGVCSAYLDYENSLINAYKKPFRADAAADDGEGSLSAEDAATYRAKQDGDKRSLAQQVRDHQHAMQSVYNSYAEELSQAWKSGR